LSRFTTGEVSAASHCKTKLEPIKPAPPVIRMGWVVCRIESL
jgi:hypothetical protein